MLWSRTSLALALVCAVACASAPEREAEAEAEAPSSPSLAATSSKPARASGPGLVLRSQSFAAPVSVVASPTEAVPCEQMCGRLGDCLDARPHESSALELSCLDLCVNVREDAPVAAKFRGCQGRDSCGALLECAEQHWEQASLARVEYDPLVDMGAVNACEAYCTGVYGCMYYDKTMAQGLEFNDSTQREVDSCISACNPEDPIMLAAGPCSSELTCMEYWDCLERSQNSRF